MTQRTMVSYINLLWFLFQQSVSLLYFWGLFIFNTISGKTLGRDTQLNVTSLMHSEFVRLKRNGVCVYSPATRFITHYREGLILCDFLWLVFSYPDVCMFPLLFLVSCRASISTRREPISRLGKFSSLCLVGFSRREHNIDIQPFSRSFKAHIPSLVTRQNRTLPQYQVLTFIYH